MGEIHILFSAQKHAFKYKDYAKKVQLYGVCKLFMTYRVCMINYQLMQGTG